MDWGKPSLTALYTAWPSDLIANAADQAKLFDGATHAGTIPTGAVRWSSSNLRWEKWNGSAWVELLLIASQTYAIRVNTADNLNGQAASYYLNNANATGILSADKGGSGFSSYTIGDILYADTASTLAKRAGVAVGNALISGGVGVAFTWGKIGLGTHVSGVLPLANGGTGLSSATAANYVRVATGGAAFEERTPAQVKTDLSLAKADVGLSNVDNTADTAKPVSTAQQTALDLKAPAALAQNTQNANYTLVLADFTSNKQIYKTDGNAWAWTVAPNSSVAAAIGAMSTLVNDGSAGNITVTQGAGVTIQLAGTTTTGNRTLARGGVATLLKVGTDKWYISGAGVT